jgi:hypothetical protein
MGGLHVRAGGLMSLSEAAIVVGSHILHDTGTPNSMFMIGQKCSKMPEPISFLAMGA